MSEDKNLVFSKDKMLARSSGPLDLQYIKQQENMDGCKVFENDISESLTQSTNSKVYMCTGKDGCTSPVFAVDCVCQDEEELVEV